ncbi:MAG: cytochrome P450 [Acidobacteriota bacterium]|nr:cytochrome P450 [Acidobacteriota bacterium]
MAATLYPPGPRLASPVARVRGYVAFRRDPLSFLTRLAREHGDIVHFRVGNQHAYLLNHPDLIRDALVTNQDCFHKGRALQRSKRLLGEGLLTSEGERHRRQRRLAQPAFHKKRIDSYGRVMTDYAARHTSLWRDGASVDIAREMTRLTLAIVGKTLFDADVESDADDIGGALTEIMGLFNVLLLPYSEYLERLPLPQTRRFERARSKLDGIIYRIIEERRRDERDAGDLLSMLLRARDEEGDRTGMTDEQIRDEVMTLILAGHETTANALSWTWHLLAQNAEAESKLHAELDEVLDRGRLPTVEDLPRLPYTEMVVSESMRLYPPAWVLGRLAVKDFRAGDFTIPAGSLVLLSQWVTQRDARFFTEPETFRPERWTAEARESRHAYSYFPFGGGARRCVGEGFAWMEGVLLVAAIASRWRMKLDANHLVETYPRITLRPKNGIRVTLEKRMKD